MTPPVEADMYDICSLLSPSRLQLLEALGNTGTGNQITSQINTSQVFLSVHIKISHSLEVTFLW